MTPLTLKVWPNPFRHVDHRGQPCGVLPYEPEGDGVITFDARRFVGATLQATILQKFPEGDARQTVQDTSFVFSDEPTTVRDSAYYRSAVKNGELLPADAETARKVGMVFKDPAEALRDEQTGAAKHWTDVAAHDAHSSDVPEGLKTLTFGPMGKTPEVKLEEKKKAPEDAAKKSGSPKGGA